MTTKQDIIAAAGERPAIHIKYVRYSKKCCAREFCPTCNKNTFFVSLFEEWYGWDSTCLKCGDRWQSGELCPRPFARGWRKKSIEQAKRWYKKLAALAAESEG